MVASEEVSVDGEADGEATVDSAEDSVEALATKSDLCSSLSDLTFIIDRLMGKNNHQRKITTNYWEFLCDDSHHG